MRLSVTGRKNNRIVREQEDHVTGDAEKRKTEENSLPSEKRTRTEERKENRAADKKTGRTERGEIYWAWFCGIPGLYLPHQKMLLEQYQDPRAVWEASGKSLEALEKQGWRWIEKVRQFKKDRSPEQFADELQKRKIQFVSRMNDRYPQRLLTIENAPNGLFYKGRLPEEDRRSVAVVGARMCTRYGRETAEQIARMTAVCGGQLVSGAAYGIDGTAQMMALESGGLSFGVLGCGAGKIYPSGNRLLFERLEQQGGIISEFPPDAAPLRTHFPVRNRLISGLADAVIVVEARKRSGSLITADYAAEQNRDVYAVPGRIGDELSEGCNELIFQGAGIFLSVKHLREIIFGVSGKEKAEISMELTLAPSEKLVYSNLDLHARSLSDLQSDTGLSFSELGEILLRLELDGLARETAKNYYAKVN